MKYLKRFLLLVSILILVVVTTVVGVGAWAYNNPKEAWAQIQTRFLPSDLKIDWQQFYTVPGKKVLVSNLPYQISSSLVIERSMDKDGLDHMVLMFQKEVAQRIAAKARSENYGMLTVIAQTFWKTETVTEAGPRDFDPPPNVASRVLAFTARPTVVKNGKAYLTFVKSAFAQRRKLLKKNISSLCQQKGIAEEQLVAWLLAMGFTETARAEELSPEQFVELYMKFGFES